MPSRNAVNKPTKTGHKKAGKPSNKPIQIAPGLTTKSAGKVTTKVISKKRAKKDVRNAKYLEQYVKSRGGQVLEDAMVDEDDDSQLSATQRKLIARKLKIERDNAINLDLEADLPAEEIQLSSSGQGTTLGAPPVYN